MIVYSYFRYNLGKYYKGRKLKVSKEKLLNKLKLVQNKLRNEIVVKKLNEYVSIDTFDKFKNSINFYINSIDNIFLSNNEIDFDLILDNLEKFLENTESDTRIELYHIKIIDSMNLIIDSTSKFANNVVTLDNKIETQKTKSKKLLPIIEYEKNDFPNMRESGKVVNKRGYTVAEYEDRGLRLEKIAESIKDKVKKHFVLYDYRETIRTNSEEAVLLLKKLYPMGIVYINDRYSMTLSDILLKLPEKDKKNSMEYIFAKEKILCEGMPCQILDKHTKPLLGIKTIAKVFSQYIIEYKSEYTSTIIGIFGKWGRGKTFFYEQLEQNIKEQNKKIYFCKFQPWKYQKQESAWAYLYEKILDNYLENKMTPFLTLVKNAKKYIQSLFVNKKNLYKVINSILEYINFEKIWKIFLLNKNRIGIGQFIYLLCIILIFLSLIFLSFELKFNLVSGVISILGFSGIILFYKIYNFYIRSKNAVFSLITLYGKTNNYSKYLGFQNEIEKELKFLVNTYITDEDERLILFVDDLDRCDENMIVNIIDNLRLVLEDEEINKKLTIITSIDERILLKSIKHKYCSNEDYKINPKEYIEKFFLVGLKLNNLNNNEREELVDEYTQIFNNFDETQKNHFIKQENNSTDDIIDKKETLLIDNNTEVDTNVQINETLRILSKNEIIYIKKLLVDYEIDTPRKINMMIQRYLLFKNFIFEELGNETDNFQLYISLLFHLLEGENLQKLQKDIVSNKDDEVIEIKINNKIYKEKKDKYLIVLKYAEMVSPF